MMRLVVAVLLSACILTGCGTSEIDKQESDSTTSRSEEAKIQPSTVPYNSKPHVIPGLIETEHYDRGSPGVAYLDNDKENLGVDYRADTQVDIEQRPDASNGHGIGWTRTGEWLNYTVTVQEEGAYQVEFPVASNKQGGIFHLEIAGSDVTGPIEVPDTGSWKTLKRISAKTKRLDKGQFVLKMVMDQQGESGAIGDIDYMKFVRIEPEEDK